MTYSFSFQKLKVIFSQPWVSETPAMPSSPHRKARDRACSWGKSATEGQRLAGNCQWTDVGECGRGGSYGSRRLHRDYNPRELDKISSAGPQWAARESGNQEANTGSPLALSNIGTPFLPVLVPVAVFLETSLLLGEVLVAVKDNHCGRARGESNSAGSAMAVVGKTKKRLPQRQQSEREARADR